MDKITREEFIKTFISGLGGIDDFGIYEIFAWERFGDEVRIDFESKEVAKKFLKTYGDKIKELKYPMEGEESRKLRFNGAKEPHEWRMGLATMKLGNIMKDTNEYPEDFYYDINTGAIRINKFKVAVVRCGADQQVHVQLKATEIKDAKVPKLKEMIERDLKNFNDVFY